MAKVKKRVKHQDRVGILLDGISDAMLESGLDVREALSHLVFTSAVLANQIEMDKDKFISLSSAGYVGANTLCNSGDSNSSVAAFAEELLKTNDGGNQCH